MTNLLAKKFGLAFGFLGSLIFVCLQFTAIFRSTNSTAPIGIIFVPILGLMAFTIFFIFGYCIGYIKTNKAKEKISIQFIAATLIVFGIGGFVGKEVITGFLVMKVVSEVEHTESNDKLLALINESFLGKNKFVLGAIVQKQTVSSEVLYKIAHLSDPELFEAMGSLFPVMGKNEKGLAVMRLLVMNKNISSSTIEYLASNTRQEYVLGTIAGSSKTSVVTLRRLELERNYLIDWGLAQNPSTPQDVFARLLDRKKDFSHRTTLEMILQNSNASEETKIKAQKLLTRLN
jgi:hypothetical protein